MKFGVTGASVPFRPVGSRPPNVALRPVAARAEIDKSPVGAGAVGAGL